jgi:hypothetical protein
MKGEGPTVDRLGAAGDDLYAALLDAHEGLSDEESAALNSRLVLLLMNAVGDPQTIRAAIARAAAPITPAAGPKTPPRP